MSAPTVALLFDFDGTVYTGDLPYHSYARHICEHLDSAAATELIGRMREFLEERSPDRRRAFPMTLQSAEDGYQAIGNLAAAAGVPALARTEAYHRSREDLALNAFALDPAQGLPELLADLGGRACVVVATNAPVTGVREVLESIGLLPHIDLVITDADKPRSMPGILDTLLQQIDGPAEHLIAVGDRWTADLADAATRGCHTAFVDRFHSGAGNPSWRGEMLASMIGRLRDVTDVVPGP